MKNYILIGALLYISLYGFSQSPGSSPNNTESFVINYQNQSINGEVGFWNKLDYGFECNEKILTKEIVATKTKLTKPLIIVEGFDVGDELTLELIYGSINSGNNPKGILEVLRHDGWDIVVLNLKDNTTDIRANAKLLEEVLNNINQKIIDNHEEFDTPIHRPVVMGISMGSLVVRYCLTDMEYRDIDHKVEKYISFDGPNKGANIPLGFQHFADTYFGLNQSIAAKNNLPDFMVDLLNQRDPFILFKNLEGSNTFLDIYDSKAGLQMVMMHTECTNQARADFVSDLKNKGNYPEKCRKIAIANGASGNNNRQFRLSPSVPLMEYSTPEVCLSNSIPAAPPFINFVNFRICPISVLKHDVYTMPGKTGSIPVDDSPCALIPSQGESRKSVSMQSISLEYAPRVEAEGGLIDFSSGPLTLDISLGRSNLARNIESKNKNMEVDHVAGGFYPLDFFSSLAIPPAYKREIRLSLIERIFKVGGKNVELKIVPTLEFNSPAPTLDYKPLFSFVPTVSSLDIQTDDWEYDAASLGNYTQNNGMTPFDAIYTHFRNSQHAFIDVPASGDDSARLDMPEFMLEELSPEQLYIQDRTFEAGYVNTFESRNFIAIGNDVDPITGRSNFGDVVVEEGASVTFSVPAVSGDPDAGFVYFDDGFDSNGGDVEVIFNELPNCGGRLLASASDDIAPEPEWNTLRRARITQQKPEQEDPFAKLVYFDETQADAKHIYEGTFGASISPNPYSEEVVLNLFLPTESTVAATVFSTDGSPVKDIQFSGVLNSGSHEFHLKELRSLKPGAYLIKIQTEETAKTIKVIKQ